MKKLIKKLRLCYSILKSDNWMVATDGIVGFKCTPRFWNNSIRQLNNMLDEEESQNAAVDEVNSILNNK